MLLTDTDTDTDEHRIRHRLHLFYRDAARADLPEATRLATTIETWWPAVHTALTTEVTNAGTEGFNRIIKQTKRVGCGFRNLENYQRRILSTIALTRAPTRRRTTHHPAESRRAAEGALDG